MSNKGTLYIVATPIGNLDDISQHALKVLTEVDLIACEDTRHSGRLLKSYGLQNQLTSYHQHNENESTEKIIARLNKGDNVALISDAGTPLISDPGYPLVHQCHKEGIKVSPITGSCALIALLSSSGLPTYEFQFIGFLPAKSNARKSQLETIKSSTSTTVFYESTHRILSCLEDLQSVIGGDRQLALGRELTKTFETIKLASISEMKEFIESDTNQQKGEFVLALAGSEKNNGKQVHPDHLQLAQILNQELPPKKAAKLAAQHYGVKAKELYNLLIQSD